MVGEEGLEPSCLATLVPKTNVYTNSTIRPFIILATYCHSAMKLNHLFCFLSTLSTPTLDCFLKKWSDE